MSNLPVPINPRPLRVLACPSPFKQAHEEYWLAPAQSLLSILKEVQPDISRYKAHVWVNDEYIPPDAWASTFPAPGSEIAIRVIPQGDIGRALGSIFVAIAAIAVAILVPWLIGPAFPILGPMLGALGGMGVSFLGNLALNAMFPPTVNPSRQSALSGGQDSPTYSLTGGSNAINKYAPVPKILGRHKVFPGYGAKWYTEIVGDDQYLRLYFVWGFGPIELEELVIGDTPWLEYEGLEYEHRNLTYLDPEGNRTVYGDNPLTLYTEDVHEEQLSIYLEKDNPQIRTSQAGVRELSVDITWQGLYGVDSQGNRNPKDWTGKIDYRVSGSSDPWILVEAVDVSAATASVVRRGWRWTVNPEADPNIQYDVRLTGFEAEVSTWGMNKAYWTALRSIKPTDPVNIPVPVAKTVIRIKATNSLSGVVQNFSGIATGVIPDWDQTLQQWVLRTTQNPASCALEWARGIHKQKPFADQKIDWPKFQHWHEYCQAQGWKYNKVVDYKVNFWELFSEIAAAGRAARTWIDGKLSAIVDEPKEFQVGPTLTPRNTSDLESEINYPDLPHAFRCAFKNELVGYKDDERIVLDDGYQIEGLDAWGNPAPDLPPATIFQELPLLGITHPDLIFRHARYHFAAARLREFEGHELTAHAEILVATRGDRVKCSHDVLLVGLAFGRVKELVLESPSGYLAGVVLDENCPMEAGKDYCIRFSRDDNSSLLVLVVTVPGPENIHLTFREAMAPAAPWPQVGNIFQFGESGKESIDLLVKSIRPNKNHGGRLALVPYNEAIYRADQGLIPPHDPKCSFPPEWWVPVIEWIRSGGSVLFRSPDGSWQPRILLTFRRMIGIDPNITDVEAQYWRTDSGGAPSSAIAPLESGELSLLAVEDGVSYDLRLRYLKRDGSKGPWTAIRSHTVEGKTAPPADVSGLLVYQTREMITLSWSKNPDLDLRGYELRYGSEGLAWASATLITEVMLGTAFSTPLIPPGTWDFLVKAVDTSGNYSDLEARKTFAVTQFYQTLAAPNSFPLWAGVKTNMIRDPLTGSLVPKDLALASGDNFDVFDNFVVNPYPTYSYQFPEIDLGADYSGRAWARIYAKLGPGQVGDPSSELQVDYRKEAGAYDGFASGDVIVFAGRYIKFKLIHTAFLGNIVLTDFQPVVDKGGDLSAFIVDEATGNVGVGGPPDEESKMAVFGGVRTNGQFVSDVATGTPPLVVASATRVSNLNADLLDGYEATAFALVGHNHDGLYAPISHDHAGVYEPVLTKGDLTAGSNKIAIGGTGAGALIGPGASVDVNEGNLTHDNLGGLPGGDPHTQYLTSARADTWFGGKNTGQLAEGINLYFTSARARDSIAADAPITYNSGTGKVGINQAGLDHGSISGLEDDDHRQYPKAYRDQAGNACYGVDIRGCANFAASVAAIGSTPATLVLGVGTHDGTGITIPSTLLIVPQVGTILSIGNNNCVINNLAETAPFYWISITGSGTVVFGDNISKVHGEWFGCVGNDSSDNSLALNRAFLSVVASGKYKDICLGSGVFSFGSTVNRYKLAGLKGSGPSTVLKPTSAADLFIAAERLNGWAGDCYYRIYDGDYAVNMTANANNIRWFYSAKEIQRLKFQNITVHHNPSTSQVGFHHVTNYPGLESFVYDVAFEGIMMEDCNAPTGPWFFEWTGGTSSDNTLLFIRCGWRGTMKRLGTFYAVKDPLFIQCKTWTRPSDPVRLDGTGGSGLAFVFGDASVSESMRGIELQHVWLEGFDKDTDIPIIVWSHTATRGIIRLSNMVPRDLGLDNILLPNWNQQFTATYVNTTQVQVSGDQTSAFLNGYKVVFLGADGQYYWSTCNGNSTYAGGVTTITVATAVVPADVTKIVRSHDYDAAGGNTNPSGIDDANGDCWRRRFYAAEDITASRDVRADTVKAKTSAGLGLFEDGGKGLFVKDGSGFLGIGTTNPLYLAHIYGLDEILALDSAGDLTAGRTVGLGLRIQGAAVAGMKARLRGGITVADMDLDLFAGGDLTTPKAVLTGDGKLGVNTTLPYDALEVAGAIAATGNMTGNNSQGPACIMSYNGGGMIQAVDWGVEYKNLFLNPYGGNVGIATTSFSSFGEKVAVKGGMRISAPSSDHALEIGIWNDGSTIWGLLQAYKRDTATGVPIYYEANKHCFSTGNVGIKKIDPNLELDVNGSIAANGQFISSLASGTAPLVIASTTMVANLNADLLDGYQASAFALAGHNHTGVYEPVLTKGNLTAGSNKVSIGGTGAGALIGPGASVDVNEGNLTHNNLGGLPDGDPHTQYLLTDGSRAISGSTWNMSTPTVAFRYLVRGLTDSYTTISGGSAINLGANVVMYGESHATVPNLTRFRNAGTTLLEITGAANVGIGLANFIFGTNAAKVLGFRAGTAPTSAPADVVQLWCEDINAVAGKAGLHMMAESGTNKLVVAGIILKSDTGDPAQVHEGLMCINTYDNKVKIYAEGAWRQLATW